MNKPFLKIDILLVFFFQNQVLHKLSPFSHKLTNAVPEIALVVKKEVVFITAFIIVFI